MGDGGLMEPALEVAIEKMIEREFKRANKRVIAEARVTAKKETTEVPHTVKTNFSSKIS